MAAATPPDHFGPSSTEYVTGRPTYPVALYEWLASVTPRREMAWDCGCGSGQATAGLVDHFAFVVATDASAMQLAHAPPLPRVAWSLASAEASGLPDQSVDAVVIAQALHWFDLERFWPEVRRIVRPGGIVTAWTYGLQVTGDELLDSMLTTFAGETVGAWWPAERRHVDAGYRTLPFPFDPVVPPEVTLAEEWDVARQTTYLRSWSAVNQARVATGHDPVAGLEARLRDAWGDGRRRVEWPLTILAGIVRGDEDVPS